MLKSTRQGLPAEDYVSIVASLYSERITITIGAAVTSAAAAATYLHTGAPILALFSGAFVVLGVLRFILGMAFDRANIGREDADAAEVWELRLTIATCGLALVYGLWSFSSLVLVADPFAALASTMVSIAVLIGLTSRNFAADRIVTISSLCIGLPIAAGLMSLGQVYYSVIAVLLMPFLFSLRKLAGNVRQIFLAAVHGRQEATRLAAELDMALATMPHGLCMLDRQGTITVINKQIQMDFLGTSNQEFVGRKLDELIDAARRSNAISKTAAEYLKYELTDSTQSKLIVDLVDGRHCEVTFAARDDYRVIMFEDITERVQSHDRITHMARYDGLTQLPNRTFFTEQVQARLSELDAIAPDENVMLMLLDIDEFKHVNDTKGHMVGDMLIQEVADRLRQVFGHTATVARFGGDEFIIFQSVDVTETSVVETAMAVLAANRVPFLQGREDISVTVSVGAILDKGAERTLERMLTKADLALYAAKADGKSTWCLFEEAMDIEYKQRQGLKADLLLAIDADELFLNYQPIIDLATRKIIGCEALVRWQHPTLGVIPPFKFIPLAESIGIITDLTKFVLRTAARECLNWPEHMNVSVNLSATDFRTVSVEAMVSEALENAGLPPNRLIVEVTETALIDELEKVAAALAALRSMGVGVALDDFGTGYSSLGYLHTMYFNKLKIDRSFVTDITTSERSRKLLVGIANLSHDLDMSVTVEGIETEEQLDMILECGLIEHAQGYLFGRPLSTRDIGELIARSSPKSVPGQSHPKRRASAAN